MSGVRGQRVLVQGCGDMGEAVARQLVSAGAKVLLSDLVSERATALAEDIGGEVVAADAWMTTQADVFAPCAVGGVINDEIARKLKVRVVCGAANNVLAEDNKTISCM